MINGILSTQALAKTPKLLYNNEVRRALCRIAKTAKPLLPASPTNKKF